MFKDRFKEARKNAGLSQEKLGNMMGISKQTVSDYERGYSEPDMAKITLAMQILKVDPNFLWQDEMCGTQSKPELSEEAMRVANAYDSLSDYGKSMIEAIVKNEEKYVIRPRMPVIVSGHDSDIYARYNAKHEVAELQQEETSEKTEE